MKTCPNDESIDAFRSRRLDVGQAARAPHTAGLTVGVLLAGLAACSGSPTPAGGTSEGADAGTVYNGFASYHPYDNVPGIDVACSPAGSTEFDPKNFGFMVTALQDRLFDERGKADVCHKCAVVTSLSQDGGQVTGQSVTVRIIDRTQDHTSNGGRRYLDLAPEAFSMIGDIARGFIPIRFTIAECPAELR